MSVVIDDGKGVYRGTLVFLRWKDGPDVMICCDIWEGGSHGHKVSGGPPWVEQQIGTLASHDGRSFSYELETTDGRGLKCRLDGKEYDLAKGTLFLVNTKGAKRKMEQLSRDLSAVQPEVESCKDFARKDPALNKFFGPGAD